jgi:hypothetical protein
LLATGPPAGVAGESIRRSSTVTITAMFET